MTTVAAPARWAHLPGLVTLAGERPTLDVTSPADGSLVGRVPLGTPDDVALAVERARAAQGAWAALPPARRVDVVRRFADLVLAAEQDLLDVCQAESGKNRLSAFAELSDVVLTCAYYARTAASHLRPRRRRGAVPVLTRTVEHHRPKGVVGIIAPWNYPLTLAVSDAVPALLAGNAVVLKPDSTTPLSALALVRLLREAGLPEDVLAVVTGPGRELGPAMIDRVDYLMFTGSTATGRTVARQCADRLIGCSAELGGKNPALVLDDADLERTVDGLVEGCFSNSGQLCVSIERIYVTPGIADAFVRTFAERVAAMRVGPGPAWDVEMGSLVSEAQLATVTAHVDDAVAKGARVLAGGRPLPELGPLFYAPTVLTDVPDDAVLARSETFGPVVSVYRVADVDEAVRRANDTEYGLNASVWSRRQGRAVAARLRAGTVNVNEGYAAAWASHDAPMGGWGISGLGRRHGAEGILKYTEAQTVAEQRLLPVTTQGRLAGARYPALMGPAVRVLRRLP
jgi:succinate-semialdehyde dehydrogenase/glutarate-semialdehyde dehydrogenase